LINEFLNSINRSLNQPNQLNLLPMISKEQIAAEYQLIQDEICTALEQCDGLAHFEEEKWEREGGGGGRTRIIQNGKIFEKGGVNFSAVYGQLPHTMKKALNVDHEDFFATGVSIVIHPNHPMVPIIHMNIRYFEMPSADPEHEPLRWFGGGMDLTPHYIIDGDAQYFHAYLKSVCAQFNSDFYRRFKTWADDYFFIKLSLNFQKPWGAHLSRYILSWLNVTVMLRSPNNNSFGNTSAAAVTPNLTWYMMPALNSDWKQMAG
jgi:hypothetical protein